MRKFTVEVGQQKFEITATSKQKAFNKVSSEHQLDIFADVRVY